MAKTIWIINQYASTPEYGYAGRHYYLGRELAKLGFNVYLITSAAHHLLRERPDFGTKFHFEKDGGLTVVWVKMPEYSEAHSQVRALGWFLFPWRIQSLARRIKDRPDVVLCSSPSIFSFWGAKRLARKFGARLMFEVRDIWPLTLTEIGGHSPSHPFIRLMQKVEDQAYRDSERVVSNLRNAVEHMVGRGMERGKFSWIPNGFSLDEVRLAASLTSDVQNQLPDNKFVVGYTGTVGVANALDTLLDAAALLQEHQDIAFVVVGGGKQKQELQARVAKEGLDNIYFIDPIPKIQVQAMLARFDVCYLGWLDDPLYRFGIGANKIPEYLYAGKPVLHAYSGNCDPIADARAGISVPAGQPDKLAAAVLELYQKPASEREAMGMNGHHVAMETYEYGSLATQLRDVMFPEGVA